MLLLDLHDNQRPSSTTTAVEDIGEGPLPKCLAHDNRVRL